MRKMSGAKINKRYSKAKMNKQWWKKAIKGSMDTETNQYKLSESNGDLRGDRMGEIGRNQGKMNKPKHSKIKAL